MSVSYKAVGWNSFKKKYDLVLAGIIILLMVVFLGVTFAIFPNVTFEIALIRAFGLVAILLLHFILAIGPLARLDKRWLPILYNRRHLGVSLFILGLGHGLLSIITYHAGSDANPIISVFSTDKGFSIDEFPFQAFGFLALIILFIMAATSHDFWLVQLTAPVWKWLHMGVYIAYFFLTLHICFGVLQSETHPFYAGLLALGFLTLSVLHITAGCQSKILDIPADKDESLVGYTRVCELSDLEENTPLGAMVAGERVAILRYDSNRISAVSGVCQHQNGPLAEGTYIHGCLTCPWHGYQYNPEDGCSPAPFTEKIPTFEVILQNDIVYVKNTPLPAGTKVEPARC